MLPDENTVTIGVVRFRGVEVFFATDVDIRKDLYANVVLSSGTTILLGIGELVTLVYEFPDGDIITAGAERFRYVIELFRQTPLVKELVDSTTPFGSAMKCDVYISKDLYSMSCSQVVRPEQITKTPTALFFP